MPTKMCACVLRSMFAHAYDSSVLTVHGLAVTYGTESVRDVSSSQLLSFASVAEIHHGILQKLQHTYDEDILQQPTTFWWFKQKRGLCFYHNGGWSGCSATTGNEVMINIAAIIVQKDS